MKWFKHQSDARNSLKLRKVRRKYGADGYAIYWFCLEAIAYDVDKDNLTFDLKEDAETIAFELDIQEKRVEEIMLYMVEIGLFESSTGVITCLKLAESIDKSMTNSPKMRAWIGKNSVMTLPDNAKTCPELEVEVEVEKEKNINNKGDAFGYFWLNMKMKKTAKPKAEQSFNKAVKNKSDPMEFAKMLVEDTKERSRLNQFGFEKMHPTTYLNQSRWEDDKPEDIKKEYGYIVDKFNKATEQTDLPLADGISQQHVDRLKHLYSTTSLSKDNIGKYFDYIATHTSFAWERGETGSEPMGLLYFLTEQAYNTARGR